MKDLIITVKIAVVDFFAAGTLLRTESWRNLENAPGSRGSPREQNSERIISHSTSVVAFPINLRS